jgi:tRNA-uridine 2-sulfurtransferase
VCRRLGVPHYVFNVQREFQTFVIDYFCSQYQQGRTPHPCIACNDRIKFSFLAQLAGVGGKGEGSARDAVSGTPSYSM